MSYSRFRIATLLVFVAGVVCVVAEERYDERYRPQFHFSPQMNWTNDPCGLVYAFGKYHLFFQHNPFANVWGHMSWGHAASADLVHWAQLPVAISDDPKVAIFTGSSVVDGANTSGLCASPPEGPATARDGGCIVSIYTGYTAKTEATAARQTQNLAYSQDGVTWTKYSGNPVLDLGRDDTRDPKVFWYAPGKQWIMVIVLASEKKIRMFASPNLKQWHALSDFGPQGGTGGEWECPDLYRLPLEGRGGEARWILKIGLNPGHIAGGSGEQYFIGRFDGTRFENENPANEIRWLDYGRDSYCELTFNNEPKEDAPRMIGWMNNWQYAGVSPTSPWRGAMTLPRVLSLSGANGRVALLQRPIEELKSLRGEAFEYQGASEADLNRKLTEWPHRSQTFEMEATVKPGEAKQITWRVLQGQNDETIAGFDTEKGELFLDRSKCANANFSDKFPSRTVAPLKLGAEPLLLHIFVDRSSVEIFAQDGRSAMTNLAFPNPTSTGISLSTAGGRLDNVQVKMWPLRSAWR